MSYEFREWEEDLEAQASGGRLGGPPRKRVGIGVLDPPGPPKRSPGPLAAQPASLLLRLLAWLLLIGLTLFLLSGHFSR